MPAAAGFAHFQALAEWKSRYKAYPPHGTLMDPYARFVTDRWVYLIAATAMPYEVDQINYGEAEVIREYYVDADGLVWATTKATPYAPIGERGDPVQAMGVGYPGGLFPRLTGDGKAVWSWLILSPFQLPSATVKALDSKKLFQKVRQRVSPLWDWRRRSSLLDDDAALTSKDGWSLMETPLWLSAPKEGPYKSAGEHVRVAVGFDPFAVAQERSRVFVDLYLAYQKRFEPQRSAPGNEYQRMALAERLDEIVWLSDRAREKFGKYLDSAKLSDAILPYREARHRAIKGYEDAAARLNEILLSELFGVYLEGAMDTEGIDDDARSLRLDEALRVLAHCTRYLGSAKSGVALLRYWALRSEENARHFSNRILLPLEPPPNSHIRSFRWGSKAIASILVQYASHKVSVAKISAREQVLEKLLEPLVKLSGSSSDVGGIMDDMLESTTIKPQWLHYGVDVDIDVKKAAGSVDAVEVHTVRLDANHLNFLEEWVDAGAATRLGRDAKLLETKKLLANVLDVINLALACQAAIDEIEQGKWPGVRDLASMGAHALNLTATIVEACAAEYQLSTSWTTGVRGALVAARAVASAMFAVSNVNSALEAYEKHDYSVTAAMTVAAFSEATTCAASIWVAASTTSVAGPWVMLAATVVTAAAYIVATWTKDEPLEVFLENCEFGRAPYAADFRPGWSDVGIGEWRSSFAMQQRLLMKIVGRFTVSEAHRGIAIAGIEIKLSMFTPRSVLRVWFDAEYADNSTKSEKFKFTEDKLPNELPGIVKTRPSGAIYDNAYDKPVSLVATVKFLLFPNGQAEEVRLRLIVDGKSATPNPISSVE